MQPLHTCLSAWLSLALTLLIGLAPEQLFVVCFGEDGCVSIEMKAADSGCGHCEGHEEISTPVQGAVISSDDVPCPCIDVEVPGLPEGQLLQSRSIELPAGFWVAPALEIPVQHLEPTVTAARGPPAYVPRVADCWAHIRTVVLLV
jgi:hypothetical protein